MGTIRSIASGSVREDRLRETLRQVGVSWHDALHITATTSLAASLREAAERRVALPVATLSDLIVLPGHPTGFKMPLDGFPDQSALKRDPAEYQEQLNRWRDTAAGRRLRVALEMDVSLRRTVARGEVDPDVGRLLVASRREFTRTVSTLAGAGLEPDDIRTSDPLARSAVVAWRQMERDVPAMTTARRTLWIDPEELDAGRTESAADVLSRVRGALDRAFEPRERTDRRTIVHHGFYFYTASQWALFQLMRRIPELDQVFVVHDDGENPAFKTWRIFFSENEWNMPAVALYRGVTEPTPAAAALRNAMAGRRVEPSEGPQFRVLECRNPAEFVREWRRAPIDRPSDCTYFAADPATVRRYIRRLDRDTTSGPVDLAELPVGSFLLAVHDCIDATPGRAPRVKLTGPALIDMAGSGFLDVPGAAGTEALAALRRALPFFRGCTSGDQWIERAHHLERLLLDEVSELDPEPGAADSDVERMRVATSNPLRLVPWGDLSPDESRLVRQTIEGAVSVIGQTAAQETVSLVRHLAALRDRLETAMREVPKSEASRILDRFRGFQDVGDIEIGVEGLIDVVKMLLGREADVDETGDLTDDPGPVKELRALDALGFRRIAGDLHLANLAEGAFPSRVPAVGWPFTLADVDTGAVISEIPLEIMAARSRYAAQSDLYLLWLALDGVEPTLGRTTLSWISELGGERRTPSSLMSLLMEPQGVAAEVVAMTGGVSTSQVPAPAASLSEQQPRPEPAESRATDGAVEAAAALVPPGAGASAYMCARRFAFQWAVGDSPSFVGEHHHAILYGNVLAVLQRGGMPEADATQLCDDFWRQLTSGERRSSFYGRRVQPAGASASREWILTMSGSKTKNGTVDQAYRAAIEGDPPAPDRVAPAGRVFLPLGTDDEKICALCPAKDRCAVARLDQD